MGHLAKCKKWVLPGSAISTTINVDPYTSYYIFVQAFTDKGTGPWSAPLRVRSSESGEWILWSFLWSWSTTNRPVLLFVYKYMYV